MEMFHRKIRNPNLGYLGLKHLGKLIHEKAKKTSICPHCNELNGTVKKCGALKISYEKFRSKKNDPQVNLLLCKHVMLCFKHHFC